MVIRGLALSLVHSKLEADGTWLAVSRSGVKLEKSSCLVPVGLVECSLLGRLLVSQSLVLGVVGRLDLVDSVVELVCVDVLLTGSLVDGDLGSFIRALDIQLLLLDNLALNSDNLISVSFSLATDCLTRWVLESLGNGLRDEGKLS